MEDAYVILDVQANDMDTDLTATRKDVADLIKTVNDMVTNWPVPRPVQQA